MGLAAIEHGDFVAALDEVRTEAGTVQAPATTVDPEAGHVDAPVELVAEDADPGAEDGAGPAIHVEEPWPGYDQMATPELIDRLHEASDEMAAVVDLYERMHRDRPPVREAAARALSRP